MPVPAPLYTYCPDPDCGAELMVLLHPHAVCCGARVIQDVISLNPGECPHADRLVDSPMFADQVWGLVEARA